MSDATRLEALPIWPSVARVAATFAIFVFHYLGLLDRYQYRLSVWALLTFSFLSGYLAHARGTPRGQWIVRRYFSVMIPHWVVMTPVLVGNWATHYKPVSAVDALITFFGGNLFLDNPLYVITWYVTFVLLLYGYLLLDSFLDGWWRLVLTAFGFLVFGGWLGCGDYFAAFTVGLYVASWAPPRPRWSRRQLTRAFARLSFRVQELCYPFFLAHGAVLLVMVKLTHLSPLPLFALSLVISMVVALAIDRVTKPLLKRALGLFDRRQHQPA